MQGIIHTGSLVAVRRDVLVHELLLVVAGSLFVAVCAKIQIPGPLPITLQTFAVVLVAAVLGSRRGVLVMVAYLLEGSAGLPVFALPVAGPIYWAGPTAGYLIGFVATAFVVGRLAEIGWDRRLSTTLAAFALGHAIILGMGFARLSLQMETDAAFMAGIWPFLPGAVLKTLLAAAALPVGWKLVRQIEPQRDANKSAMR